MPCALAAKPVDLLPPSPIVRHALWSPGAVTAIPARTANAMGRCGDRTIEESLDTAAPSRRSAWAQYVVVVHTSNPTTSLTRKELAGYLLGTATHWSHGVKVEPVDLPITSRARQALSRAVLRKSAGAVRAYWQQQESAGRGVAPRTMQTDRDVLEHVRQSPGAIGYVRAATPLVPGTRALVVLP